MGYGPPELGFTWAPGAARTLVKDCKPRAKVGWRAFVACM